MPVPIIVGICGGTGCGKTTLCKKLSKTIGHDVSIIHHDSYYKDLSHLPIEKRAKNNFDHPDAFDNDLFCVHLSALKQGSSIEIPKYDFVTHTRIGKIEHVYPANIILIDGIMIYADLRIIDLFDYKIYVDADSDIRFIRRLMRDIKERGRSTESAIEQYLSTVKPMHDKYVEPCKEYADILISGEDLDGAIETIVGMIFRQD